MLKNAVELIPDNKIIKGINSDQAAIGKFRARLCLENIALAPTWYYVIPMETPGDASSCSVILSNRTMKENFKKVAFNYEKNRLDLYTSENHVTCDGPPKLNKTPKTVMYSIKILTERERGAIRNKLRISAPIESAVYRIVETESAVASKGKLLKKGKITKIPIYQKTASQGDKIIAAVTRSTNTPQLNDYYSDGNSLISDEIATAKVGGSIVRIIQAIYKPGEVEIAVENNTEEDILVSKGTTLGVVEYVRRAALMEVEEFNNEENELASQSDDLVRRLIHHNKEKREPDDIKDLWETQMKFYWAQEDKYQKPKAFSVAKDALKRLRVEITDDFGGSCEIGKGVSLQQETKLKEIVTNNAALFDVRKIGRVKADPVNLDLIEGKTLADVPHIKNPVYSYISAKAFLDNLQPYLESGVVRDCTHEHGIRPTYRCYFLPKCIKYDSNKMPSNRYRMISDLRAVNTVSQTNVLPTPTYMTISTSLARASVVSSCDIASAYNLIRLSESSSKRLCFAGPNLKRYRMVSLPQGHCGSAGTLMGLLVKTTERCIMKHGSIVQIFADDVLVISMDGTTVDQHLEDLQIFFEGFKKDGWQINIEKTQLLLSREKEASIEFLGRTYRLSNEKMGTTSGAPDKHIRALKNLLPPKTTNEAQSFLASTNFQSGFVHRYADHTASYREEIKKCKADPDKKWNLSGRMIKDFNYIINAITETRTFTLPDLEPSEYTLKVWSDASVKASAAILFMALKSEPTKHYLLSCTSKAFNPVKSRSATIHHLELLAVISAFREFYAYFKTGADVEFYLDNMALINVSKTKNYNSIESTTISLKLDYYTNVITTGKIAFKYCKSEKMVADFLTRGSYRDPEWIEEKITYYTDNQIENENFDKIKRNTSHSIPTSRTDILNAEKKHKDAEEQTLKVNAKNTPIATVAGKDIDAKTRAIGTRSGQKYEGSSTDKPKKKMMSDEELMKLHIFLNHGTPNAMRQYISKDFAVKDIQARKQDIDKVLERCLTCATIPTKLGKLGAKSPFSQPISTFPMHIISMDVGHVGLKADVNKNEMFAVLIDNYSGFCKAYAMKNEGQIEVVKVLEKFTGHYGYPRILYMDNAKSFKSKLVKRYLSDRNIKPQYCSVQQHQSNKAETKMLEIRTALKKKLLDLTAINTEHLTTLMNPYLGDETREKRVAWSDFTDTITNYSNHIPRKFTVEGIQKCWSPSQIFFNSSYKPFIASPIAMKEAHGFRTEPIDQNHLLAAKLSTLADKPDKLPEKYNFAPGDIVIIQTLNTTKNTKTFRSHELFQVCEVFGAIVFIRNYNRPLDDQPQFSVHINLLMRVDPAQMILHSDQVQEIEPVKKFRDKQTVPTATTETNAVYS